MRRFQFDFFVDRRSRICEKIIDLQLLICIIHEYARCIIAALFMCLAKVPDAFNLPHRPRAEDAQRGNDGVVSERFSLAAAKAVADLLERFDIEPFSDFSAKMANFIGLVLFCIDAKFCKYSLESS